MEAEAKPKAAKKKAKEKAKTEETTSEASEAPASPTAPAAAPSAEKEDASMMLYMAQGIGEMMHGGNATEAEQDDDSNFLERGVLFLGELVDDIKSLPDKLSAPKGGRADNTQVVLFVSHLDADRNTTLAPIVLVELVAMILEVPAKLISTTHEKVVALASLPIHELIEDLWRNVKRAIIETYFRFLGLEDEDVDVRVCMDILKHFPQSVDIETELNDQGFGREGKKVKAINHTMSKKWMCEKIASIMDNDRDGVVSQEEAQAAAAKVADSDADLKLLKGDIARVSNNLFKHMNRDQVEKYFEALDCNNPEPPAEVMGKFSAILKKWHRSFLLKVKLQEAGWKKMGAHARKASEVAEEKRKAEQQKRLRAQGKIKKGK